MRIIFSFCLLTLFSFSNVVAQTDKGDKLFIGNFSFSESEIDNSIDSEEIAFLQVNGRVGFYVHKNVITGFGLGRSVYEENFSDYVDPNLTVIYNIEERINDYYLFLALQNEISSNLKLNINFDFKLGRGDYKRDIDVRSNQFTDPPNEEGEIINNEFLIRPGLFYFLSKTWVLNLSYGEIGFSNQKIKFKNVNDNRISERAVFSFTPDTITFGLAFRFQQKK